MILQKNTEVELGYANEIDATYMFFKRQVNEDDFIECHHDLLDLLNTRNFTSGKHLVDTSNLKIITNNSRKWVAQNFVPLIQSISKNGKVHIAVVLGSSAFMDFGAEHIQSKDQNNVHIHFFSQLNDARMWLSPALEVS